MNNIYKVIWSKAKNCYVVVSEIARSHTKSASGSEKIGGVTRRSLLASLMALSLLCGGLGVAEATVHVNEGTGVTHEVYTTVETYSRELADAKLDLKADKTDVAKNTADIATNKGNITKLENDKLDKALASETYATKDALNDLKTVVNGKADATDVNNKLANKADASELDGKANKADVYSKTDADTTFATKTELNAKADTTALEAKADRTYVDQKFTEAGTNVDNKLEDYYNKAEVDGKIKAEENARDTAITNAIGQERNDRDAAIKTAINGEVTERNQAIHTAITQEVTDRNAAVTTAKTELQSKITAEETERKETDTAFNTRLTTAEGKIGANETAIGDLKAADTALEGKITKNREDIATLNGKVATAEGNITDLKKKDTELEGRIKTNEGDIETNKNAISDINKRTAGIQRIDATKETTIEGNVTVNSLGNVTAEGDVTAKGKLTGDGVDAGAGAITTKGAVNAGSLNVTDASHLKGDVTMDQKLTVTGDTTLKGTKVDGKLTVTDEADLKNTTVGGTLGVTGEATFKDKVTMEKDLEVKGELKTDKISMKNTDMDPDGTIHRSATTITADGITHNGEVEKSGVITKSQFTHTEEGSETYAKKGNTANWTETRSDVKADGVTTKVEDSKKNRTNTSQTADGIKGYATDKDGNKTYTKVTATENSFQVQDKDGKNKNHQVNTMGSSVTEIKNDEGKTTKTEQTAENITNTAKDGTIKNDAKDIVNNASGNISNKSQTMDTTVTGKATESYGSLDTTVNGNETHIVKGTKTETVDGKVTENYNAGQATKVTGNQDIHVTGKQTNTVEGGQENIISGGQINSITGDQTTTVTGDISNKAENITNEANTKLTDKVGDNTRVLDSEGITDTVPGADGKGSTFKQRIDAIMGNVKTDAGESEVTQKGDEITSVVGKGEATNSRVTQKKGSLEAGVTDGTNTNASYDVADASAKVLSGGTKVNKLQDNLDSSEKTITNGTYTTSKLQTALDITNTAKDGTITNDAKNIVNNASGNMTNTVGGDLTTTVSGNELHEVTGTKTENVTGKVTENYGNGQETNVTGDQNIHVTGDQTTIISGTQTTTAMDINRNASSSMVDKVDNAYGTNTETKEAGKTTTDVSIKGTGEKGQYIRGANESRDYLIKGTLKNSETKTAEATSTEITDGNGKTSSTIQDVTQISGSVTDGTNTSVSNVKANSIDSAVTDGSSISTINQKKNSITSQVTDGTTVTKTEQDTKNITNTAKDGTITNDAKDIVNNASGNMTNTVGGDLKTTVSGNELHEVTGTKTENVTGKVTENYKAGQETNVTGDQDIYVTGKQTNKIDGDQENTIGGSQTTTVTGDISNKAENITNEANTKLTDKVGDNTRVLDSEGITDTVGGSTFKQRIDKIMMESKDVSIKAEETLTNEAKVITNKASEVINNEAVNINNTATGIITSKASEIKNQADKLISNKVGENTWENMENGKITTSIKDGTKQNLTQSDAAGTTQSTVDGGKSTVTIQNADGLADAVTDGTNTSVQNQTASAIAAAVKDGAGNENASAANATTSVNTIKSGSKANTVISTADGTSFINSEAAAPVGDGTEVKTTIKGNTITTGKVTMDYATVKKDLTVEGNTNLKNTKVDGTLDVTQKANFGDSVSIAKDLSVGGNATIKGDVTASSYKVGDKTYISAAGINANDQKITNVADGSISEGSKDAVNGGQLYTVKNDFEGKVNKVGANAAAMANLHPMEFDPDSKWNIAAAIGNYGSETAAALGAFYRPNDDVMVNFSTAFGTGENMVGGGVSVRLGKGGNKLSREENNALKAQVDNLTARMDALLSVLNPNMSKDFPDVPENHWAYEAVSRLAGNDIVQGYPDGEFHGDRTMTRYEMAEIIYNALSRGAEAEKELVEEFKPELQAMAASEKATAEKAEG